MPYLAAHISLVSALAQSHPTIMGGFVNFPKFAAIGKILLSLFQFEESAHVPTIKTSVFTAISLCLLPRCTDEDLWLASNQVCWEKKRGWGEADNR